VTKAAGQRAALGYHDHDVVDGGKARIILHALVTPADVMENAPMLDQLRRVSFRWRLRPARVVADTTYGTVENIRALEDAGIRAYVPLPDFATRTPFYGSARFTYHAARDEYRCPHDQPLRRRATSQTEGLVVYRAEAAIGNACPLKARCTASEQVAGPAPNEKDHCAEHHADEGSHAPDSHAAPDAEAALHQEAGDDRHPADDRREWGDRPSGSMCQCGGPIRSQPSRRPRVTTRRGSSRRR